MQYRPYDPWGKYTAPLYDPVTMTAMAAGTALVGGGISAMGTLAGGANAQAYAKMKQQASEFEATQDVQNSAAAIAGAQRQSLDITRKANLLASTSRANAAANGVNAGAGSALTNEAEIAGRGKYAAALELSNGQSAAADALNKAAASHYSGLVDIAGGDMQKEASEYSAAGTLASAGASAFSMYGKKYG